LIYKHIQGKLEGEISNSSEVTWGFTPGTPSNIIQLCTEPKTKRQKKCAGAQHFQEHAKQALVQAKHPKSYLICYSLLIT